MKNGLEMERHGKKRRVSRKVLTALAIASVLTVGCLAFVYDCNDISADDAPKGYAVDGLDYILKGTAPDQYASVAGYVGSSPVDLEIPGGVIINSQMYSVKEIENDAFKNCTTLKSLKIEGNVYFIGTTAFIGCRSLESVDMGNDVITIGAQAFYGCSKLSELKLSSKLMIIKERAFEACFALPSVTIPDGVVSIEKYAFSRCTSMKSIDVEAGNTVYVSDNGVLYDRYKTRLFICPSGIESFTVPKDVEAVEESAFSGDNPLKVEFVSGCNTMLHHASFYHCLSLTLVIKDGAIVTFENDALYIDIVGPYTVWVQAPSGYEIPAAAYNSNIEIKYDSLDDGNNSVVWVVIGVVGVLFVAGAITFFLKKKRR